MMFARLIMCVVATSLLAQCRSVDRHKMADSATTPLAWNGTYHYNSTDSDFDSHLKIQFYPNRDRSFGDWLADGTITNHFVPQKITFTRAMVNITKDGPEVYCIHMHLLPGLDDAGNKIFWIDERQHTQD
ncbi:MAG: hypothetical protein U1F71_23425 [Verrucomicrobiaceae bacterium]